MQDLDDGVHPMAIQMSGFLTFISLSPASKQLLVVKVMIHPKRWRWPVFHARHIKVLKALTSVLCWTTRIRHCICIVMHLAVSFGASPPTRVSARCMRGRPVCLSYAILDAAMLAWSTNLELDWSIKAFNDVTSRNNYSMAWPSALVPRRSVVPGAQSLSLLLTCPGIK